MSRPVVKLGGSFLRLASGPKRLQDVLRRLAAQGPAPVVVPGGGQVADLVRRWQRDWELSDKIAHELAIDSLGFTAWVLKRVVLPEAVVAEELVAFQDVSRPAIAYVPSLLHEIERRLGFSLPASWSVTSDSLAYALAWALRASGLYLVKQVGEGLAVNEAARRGIVDEYLPELIRLRPGVCVRIVCA